MYPIELSSFGWRNVEPGRMTLGGPLDAVMITGPNGIGKSTIVYASALALGGRNVDYQALRNDAHPPNETWRAGCFWLFHNPIELAPDGKGTLPRANADEFVQAGIEIVMQPKRPAALTWYIKEGPRAEELRITQRFSSRTEYVDTLRQRFRIDPDRYFQFWFQGRITSFADQINVEKANAVFEAFGLNTVRDTWREAREKCLIAWRDMQDAETEYNRCKRDLDVARTQYNRWLDKKEQLTQSVPLFWASSTAYRNRLEVEIHQCNADLAELDEEESGLRSRAAALENDVDQARVEVKAQEEARDRAAGTADGSREKAGELQPQLEQAEWEREELTGLLAEVEKKRQTVRERLTLLDEQERALATEEELRERRDVWKREKGAVRHELDGVKADLVLRRHQHSEAEQEVDRLRAADIRLPPRSELDRRLAKEDSALQSLRYELQALRDRERGMQESLKKLKQSRVSLHPMQEAAMHQQPNAWAIGELVEVRPEQSADEVERRLGALKHSILCPGPITGAAAPVYHLALDTVPDVPRLASASAASLVTLAETLPPDFPPGGGATLMAWLNRVALAGNEAAALTLVDQGYIAILPDGTLVDRYGRRGPLSQDQAIGLAALQQQRDRLERELRSLNRMIADRAEEQAGLEGVVQEAKLDLDQRNEVDAKLPGLVKRVAELADQIEAGAFRQEELTERESTLEKDGDGLTREEMVVGQALKQIAAELQIHEELARQASRLEELDQKKTKCILLRAQFDELIRAADRAESEAREAETEARRWSEILIELEKERRDVLTLAEGVESRRRKPRSRVSDLNQQLNHHAAERNQVWEWHADLIGAASSQTRADLVELDEATLYEQVKRALSDIRLARSIEVDDDADIRFFAMEERFRKNEEDLLKAKTLYGELRKDENKYRVEFRNTVAELHRNINRYFSTYLSRVGLTGEIVLKVPAHMEEDGWLDQPQQLKGEYEWEIRVAREGQNPRSVQAKTWRLHEKQGEGPSGGERGMVSLLHALAMLSHIKDRPPFYLFDEFDSALDERNKRIIFDLFQEVLNRKIIVITPKANAADYLDRFRLIWALMHEKGTGTTRLKQIPNTMPREWFHDSGEAPS